MNKSLHQIKEVFSKDEYEWLNDLSKDQLSKIDVMETSNRKWDHSIIEFSQPVSIHRILTKEPFIRIKKSIDSLGVVGLDSSLIKGVMLYYWKPGSYIPWHSDATHGSALTVYLNEDWEYNMGGLFSYYLDGEVRTVVPKKNLGVFQCGGVPHSTTIIKENAPIRRTLQIFFNEFNYEPKKII